MVAIVLSHPEIAEIVAIARVSPVASSGGNSTIKRVSHRGKNYAVKDYSGRVNGRERLAQEFSALTLVHPALPKNFPEPLGIAAVGLQAVHSWINGVRPHLDVFTVDRMLSLAADLHLLSSHVARNGALPAIDQVLTVGDILDQIRTRAGGLVADSPGVAEFTRMHLLPVLEHLPQPDGEASPAILTLSVSDFGAHNLLWDEEDQVMRCVDLEFFGWDDAHKLTIDALLHPLAHWTTACAEAFLDGAFDLYHLDERRLLSLWPYLSLKWGTITLARAARTINARSDAAAEAMRLSHSYVSHARQPPRALSDIVAQVVGS